MSGQNSNPKPRTLNDIFFQVVERNATRVMTHEQNGSWVSISSADFYKRVAGTARALISWGIGRGDRVAILSENRPEWAIADFALLMIGAAVVPIYATLTAEQCSYLLRHSGARAVFVSSKDQLTKIADIRTETTIERIIMMDRPDESEPTVAFMKDIMDSGPESRDAELDANARTVTRDDLATLIYTSGTTGTPKGVMLTHGNLASNLEVSLDAFDFLAGDISVSFLPLSHITARHVDFALFYRGVALAYCPFIEELPRVLQQIHPTVFVAVPRVYEKIYNQVQKQVGAGFKRRLYNWAIGVGERNISTVLSGKRPHNLRWQIAERLLFSKVMHAMGGRVRTFISGGAPLGKDLGLWYAKIGIQINEGYGLTETSPVIAVNNPHGYKLGTVGKPLDNLQVRIADDGEILVRGPNVFKGYWNMPDETRDTFDGEWFKTGDIGCLDVDGFLCVTDRKKDLIKTSGGKFIAPQPIENSLKANALVSEAAVIGERRKFPSVVIAPAFSHLEEWARIHGVGFSSHQELVCNPQVQALYESIVEAVNHNLAKYEKLKKVLVIPEELSIESGTLTPTLKLRRRNVEARYRELIDTLYVEDSAGTAQMK